jgi:hypothetical protein
MSVDYLIRESFIRSNESVRLSPHLLYFSDTTRLEDADRLSLMKATCMHCISVSLLMAANSFYLTQHSLHRSDRLQDDKTTLLDQLAHR